MSCDSPSARLTTIGDALREGKIKVKSILCPHCLMYIEVAVPTTAGKSVLNCKYCSKPITVEHEYREEVVTYVRGGRGNPMLVGWHHGTAQEKSDFNYPTYLGRPKTSKRIGTFTTRNKGRRIAI